jgi:tRNA pseudouridine13 synthase
MKLKQLSKDFTVKEISSIIPSTDLDSQKIFLLKKNGIDTFEALRYLARKWNIPYTSIGYAGLKDKHAITQQYISIPSSHKVLEIRGKKIQTEFVGYDSKKIRIGDLKGNHFEIVVRDIKKHQINDIQQRIIDIEKYGVFNYFDSQRFGSVINQHFIAKAIIQNNIEQAVKWFLTLYQKSEPRNVKNDKRLISAHWPNLEPLSLHNHLLGSLVNEYNRSGDWHRVYEKIPIRLRELFKNAYQSHIWNECIKHLARKIIGEKNLISTPYTAGYLYFYQTLSDELKKAFPKEFPTVSPTLKPSDFEKSVLDKITNQEQISLNDLTKIEKTGTYFSTQYRPIIIKPDKFHANDFNEDEINSDSKHPRLKLHLSYDLYKGSYATIVTKSIFGH